LKANMTTATRLKTTAPQQGSKQRIDRAQWITELNGLPQYVPLKQVTRPNLTTAEAAYYLNRRPQTLRGWACLENGPLRPTRICGLLAWSTATVKELAGVPA
jgi:hypothetical protein